MDLRTQTSLIAAVLSLAIAATVLLRPRRRRMHWLFSFFAVSIAAWYLTTFLYRVLGTDLWIRSNLVCAVVLPVAGVQFFRAFIDEYTAWMAALHRAALVAAVTIGVFIFTPLFEHIALKAAIFTYVVLMLVAQISVVYQRGKRAVSRIEGARLRYLALVGALAATFTFADYLPLLGVDIPPVGTVLTLIFLYVLSQSILRFRLLDLYELAGRLGVLTALSFSLAFIFWIAVNLTGVGFFLPSVVAAMVVLLLFDPVRAKVEDQISQLMFRERYDLERAANDLRRRIPRALEVGELARVLIDGLEQSNRVTHAAVYFV
ncbi:MAG: two-component system sensor protein, partial [Myxococcales bacterium]|nr:two-component system sensor protein [Myxococcales bacterium]